jgi:hypothetical protein
MASALLNNPTYQLQPSAEQVALQTNYITNFNFLNQYLPDTYEKEFERYGNSLTLTKSNGQNKDVYTLSTQTVLQQQQQVRQPQLLL